MRVAVLALLASCITSRWPITPAIAHGSTYSLDGTSFDGAPMHAVAWSIDKDRRHAVTAGSFCRGANTITLTVDGVQHDVTALYDDTSALCLVSSPVELARPLVLALGMSRARLVDHLDAIGSPIWTRGGVVGVVTALIDGRIIGAASLGELLLSAREWGVAVEWAPDPHELDYDIACQQDAKARGECGGPAWWQR